VSKNLISTSSSQNCRKLSKASNTIAASFHSLSSTVCSLYLSSLSLYKDETLIILPVITDRGGFTHSQHAAVRHVVHGHAIHSRNVATGVVAEELVAGEGFPQGLASRLRSGKSPGDLLGVPRQGVRVAQVGVGSLRGGAAAALRPPGRQLAGGKLLRLVAVAAHQEGGALAAAARPVTLLRGIENAQNLNRNHRDDELPIRAPLGFRV